MAIRDLITRDTNIIHLYGKDESASVLAKKTGIPEELCEFRYSWYQHDGKWYYFKRFYDEIGFIQEDIKFINELIGEIYAHKLKVPVVHYKIAELDDNIGLMSENFIQRDHEYLYMCDLKMLAQFYNDSNIPKLRKYCKDDENYRQLISEILKLVAIDFYMCQKDRNFTNIQFTRKNGEIHLAPLYDFEEACIESNRISYCSALLGITVDEIKKYPLLREYLDLLFELRMEKVLEQIEDERKIIIPEEIKNRYNRFEYDRRLILKR